MANSPTEPSQFDTKRALRAEKIKKQIAASRERAKKKAANAAKKRRLVEDKALTKEIKAEEKKKKAPPPPIWLEPITELTEEAATATLVEQGYVPPPRSEVVSEAIDKNNLRKQREILQAAIREEKRALARDNYWFFLTQVLFPKTWKKHYDTHFHRDMANRIQNMKQNGHLYTIVPRWSRKTFMVTLAQSLWRIIRDPNVRILIVNAKEDTAGQWARYLRSAFIAGTSGFEEFQSLFPEFLLGKRGQTVQQAFQFTIPNRTMAIPDPTVRVSYLGDSGAGTRCDILFFDDPYSREHVTRPEMSLDTLGKMINRFPLLDKTGDYNMVFLNATRWAYHDPAGRFIGEQTEEALIDDTLKELNALTSGSTQIVVRHAMEDPTRQCEHCPPNIVAAYPHGHPEMGTKGEPILHPVVTRDMLMQEYANYLRDPQMGESLFWHQYMNVCVPPKSQKIKPEWFIKVSYPGFPAPKRRVIALDDASKDFQSKGIGDFSVALFGEFDDHGRLILRHGLRSNGWTKKEFIERIVTWCMAANWWPQTVAKEKVSTDSFLVDLRQAFLDRFKPCHAVAVPRNNNEKKYDWIMSSLQGPLERAEIIFGRDFPVELYERAKYEGTNISRTSHDDVIDALALFFSEQIRIAVPGRNSRNAGGWAPPSMGTYDVFGQRTTGWQPPWNPSPQSAFERALEQAQYNQTLAELGLGDATITDGNPRPERLDIPNFDGNPWV